MTAWPDFVVHAFWAGTAIAAACGLTGWFLVLRAQVFLGESMSHVAFAGALAALAAGVDLRVGLFVGTVGVGVAAAGLARRGQADDVVIGTVLAWVTGLGVFFLTLYTTTRSAANGSAGITVLFGSIFGIDAAQTVVAVVVGVAVVAAVALIARPLLFASIDPAVAAARGVPVRLLGVVFLALLGAAAGEASQAVGSLLLVGLLAAPAGAAHRLTARPYVGLALAGGIAVVDLWLGLLGSVLVDALPPSFTIVAVAAASFLLVGLVTRRRDARRPGRTAGPSPSTVTDRPLVGSDDPV